MNNKKYIYFFLSVFVCTAHGNDGRGRYLLDGYDDDVENRYDGTGFFDDNNSFTEDTTFSKKNKNSKKRKDRSYPTPHLIQDIQEKAIEKHIENHLKQMLNDAKMGKNITGKVKPFVQEARRTIEYAVGRDVYRSKTPFKSVVPSESVVKDVSAKKKDTLSTVSTAPTVGTDSLSKPKKTESVEPLGIDGGMDDVLKTDAQKEWKKFYAQRSKDFLKKYSLELKDAALGQPRQEVSSDHTDAPMPGRDLAFLGEGLWEVGLNGAQYLGRGAKTGNNNI